MENIYDIIVLGAGPAGLTAALYASRAKLNVLVLEKEDTGALIMAHKIENYPGYDKGGSGRDLYNIMKEQARSYGTTFSNCTVLEIDPLEDIKKVKTDKNNYLTRGIIIATGWDKNNGKKIEGEREYLGLGVSYCGTCDGAFTNGLDVSLFGNGDEVLEEGIYLTQYAKSVGIFTEDNEFLASKSVENLLKKYEKIYIKTNTKLKKIYGGEFVEGVEVEVDGKPLNVKTDYTFLYLGTKSNKELYTGIVNFDEKGYVVTNEKMESNVEGVYVAGDIVSKAIRQVTTAVNDGTIAGLQCTRYVMDMKKK